MLERRRVLGGLLGGLVVPWNRAIGADAQVEATVPAAAITETAQPTSNVGANILQKIDGYLNKTGLRDDEDSGISVLQGIGNVIVPSNHPQWVQHRTMAFEEAVLKAQVGYVASQQNKIASEAVSSVYKAASMEPPPYDEGALGDPGKVAELVRKALAVTGGAMDKALEQLGIDPRSLEKAPPAQRHLQFEKALAISGMESSFGSLTGMIIRHTVEAFDEAGNSQIGVVAIVSPKLKNLAQSVLTLRGQFVPEPGKAQDFKAVVADKVALVDLFGVRWMYDKKGLPVIVSFAQWGAERIGTKDAAMIAEFEETAMRQAEIRAGQQIAEFLSATGKSDSNAEYKNSIHQVAERMADGYVAQKDPIKSIEAPLREAMTRRARVDNFSGLMTLTKWKQPHPDVPQQTIYGAVRYWSAAGEVAIRRQRDRTPDQEPGASVAVPRGRAGARESKDIGDF